MAEEAPLNRSRDLLRSIAGAAILCLCSAGLSLLMTNGALAANHYCIDDSTVAFSMRMDTDQPERLLTHIRNQDRYSASQRCRWEVGIRDLREPRQLVLQLTARAVTDSRGVTAASQCDFELGVRTQDYSERTWLNSSALPKAPLIVPVNSSSQKLTVSFITGPSPPSPDCPRIALTITLAKKGFCARNMLLHRSRCHLVSDTELGISDLTDTGLTLAGFSDVTQLRQLVTDNDLRVGQYPYIRPLDLSSPLRIGVFRCPGSGQAFYWDSCNGGGIGFKPFDQLLNVSQLCGLNASSGAVSCAQVRAVDAPLDANQRIDWSFVDSGLARRSLLSFAEVPSAGVCAAGSPVLSCVCRGGQLKTLDSSSSSGDSDHRAKIIFIVAVFFVVGVLSIIAAAVYWKRLQSCRYRNVGVDADADVREPAIKVQNAMQ